jgi:hypothetical protein
MIELLFSDSAAGSFAYIKETGNDTAAKGKTVRTTVDRDSRRLRRMIDAGVLEIAREHKRFYKTIVRPVART